MMNSDSYQLADRNQDLSYEATRVGFGRGLLKAGDLNTEVVALCADLTESTQMHLFKDKHPDRFFEIGIAEQNLVTVASGMAAIGKIPFTSSYAAFSPGRNWEQIRTTICLNDQAVKIVGSHAGISVGPDGATHQILEDIALMRVLPNMIVIAPGDSLEAEKAVIAMSKNAKPNYIRLAREKTAIFSTPRSPFEIGPAYRLISGKDISIISTGSLTAQALLAADLLVKDGIIAEVIHVPTIKPLDTKTIIESAVKTGYVLTLEEGQINGGLGGAISEILAEHHPTRMLRMGIKDRFGESGSADELMKYFSLDSNHIRLSAHQLLSRK